jgi:hypothetical protein
VGRSREFSFLEEGVWDGGIILEEDEIVVVCYDGRHHPNLFKDSTELKVKKVRKIKLCFSSLF